MNNVPGKSLAVPPHRRWMGDLARLSMRIPIAALEHRLQLKPLMDARDALGETRPSWVAIFLKGFASVAIRRPQLRQLYFHFPWFRLYEHPCNVAAITVEREWEGEPAIFFDMLPEPETMSLVEIHQHLRRIKSAPIESVAAFRRMTRGGAVPNPLRWFVWRWLYSFSGHRRANCIGTFAINGGTRVPIRPVTTTGALGATLYWGLFSPDGSIDVCLTFDHRVMDGGEVVRILSELEVVLNTEVVAELRALPPRP